MSGLNMDLEKVLLRKVGEAVGKFKMIRDGDRVAVALSGGKDSLTLLEAMLMLAKRAPIQFSVGIMTGSPAYCNAGPNLTVARRYVEKTMLDPSGLSLVTKPLFCGFCTTVYRVDELPAGRI